MKLYTYENCKGDEGIIIADSWEEAVEIYKKKYPKRIIGGISMEEYFRQNDKGEYVGAVIKEIDYVKNGELYCTYEY